MLFDPKWEQKTKANPLTLGSLIAWLELQPPEKKYDWSNCSGGCLIDQYGTAHGIAHLAAREPELDKIFGPGLGYARVCSSRSGPTTFGDALKRARKLAAQ